MSKNNIESNKEEKLENLYKKIIDDFSYKLTYFQEYVTSLKDAFRKTLIQANLNEDKKLKNEILEGLDYVIENSQKTLYNIIFVYISLLGLKKTYTDCIRPCDFLSQLTDNTKFVVNRKLTEEGKKIMNYCSFSDSTAFFLRDMFKYLIEIIEAPNSGMDLTNDFEKYLKHSIEVFEHKLALERKKNNNHYI